ncbi:predicted protein [Sparassis crispa]|uniref:Chitinase n=1 Tax=Sparassis crispa TaxID=139825 RepID=A0A401GW61_9APHY|nr:predicted protein [Sparassis crispa]GBE86455.1 predicted protein [Sparassis crispa]
MVLFSIYGLLSAAVLVLTQVNGVNSTPAHDEPDRQTRDISTRSTPDAPHWVAYWDKSTSGVSGAPNASDLTGYNTFILAFLLLEGAWDNAEEWTELAVDERSTILSEYSAAGISMIVSCFGSSDVPTTSGADPTDTANTFAAWVIEYDLDGIDVDYEDFDAFDAGTAEAWLVTFTQQLRTQLPEGQYILTHAPVAPWFGPNIWTNGGYLQIDS